MNVALRLWGARAAAYNCRQPAGVFTERLKTSLGKLPRLTGWQPVLPRKSHARYSVPGSARVSRVGDDVSSSQTFPKLVSARRRNQHARRVRYPETVACVGFSGEHRLPVCKSRQLAETVFNRSVNTPECCRQAAGNCGLAARAPERKSEKPAIAGRVRYPEH